MWPFAKLRNGFGSHRYVYSPILFDSQDLNHNLSTPASAPAGDAASPYTILPTTVGLCQWNGDAYDQLSFPGSCRCSVPYMSPGGFGFGNGNGECRRCSWIAAHAAGDAGRLTLYWGAVAGVMDNVEWSTEHGNIYSALWERC